jgi:sialate O-acetylesterase
MRLVSLFFVIVISIQTKANIVLPRFVSKGMVLQRDISIPIWGWAETGEKVEVIFKNKHYTTVTGLDKKWKINLAQSHAGGPFTLVLKGNNTIIIEDVLIGDVWFCSGQSNMEYELFKAAEKYPSEIATSTNSQIRHFLVKRNIAFNSSNNIESDKGWEYSNPSTVLNFSAIAYFFGRKLFEKYQVPIGLINCSYGGTPAEAWMNEIALDSFPEYKKRALLFKDKQIVDSITEVDKKYVDQWNRNVANLEIGDKEKWFQNSTSIKDWNNIIMPSFWQEKVLPKVEAGVVWFKKNISIPGKYAGKTAVLRVGNLIMKDVTYWNGIKVGTTSNKYAPRKYSIDASLVQNGENIITVKLLNESGDAGFIKDKPYLVEIGDTVISLEGEWHYKLSVDTKPLLRNDITRFQTEASAMYHGMLEPLVGYGIKGVIWYQGESNVSKANEYYALFPTLINSWRKEWNQGEFPFLYVQLANINQPKDIPYESKLANLQNAQSKTLQLPNTGMAVVNDIGEWNDVHPMNKLTAANRLYVTALKVAYNEKNIVYSGPTVAKTELSRDSILITFKNTGAGLIAKDSTELHYFQISDESKKFVWAKAFIRDNKVVVWSSKILKPQWVRYAWADNPKGANLYNQEGLPASCFSERVK